MTFTLSPTQEAAASAVKSWWQKHFDGEKDAMPFFYLAGYAGTGKTSIAKTLVEQLTAPIDTEEGRKPATLRFAFAAFTGKASLVLSKKGCKPASTIHRLIYQQAWDDKKKEFYFVKRFEAPDLDLIILDECSMVNFEIGTDLLSYNIPILVLGDPGQLPPVDGAGFFTSKQPDFLLTEIHRQALESPILKLATDARTSNPILPGLVMEHEDSIVTVLTQEPSIKTLMTFDQILVGTNVKRTQINSVFRRALQYTNVMPMVGEKLICLKNNWSVPGMLNGSLWRVESIKEKGDKLTPNRYVLEVTDWDDPASLVTIETHACFFDQGVKAPENSLQWKNITHLTFGYAITCHKSQGSEWESVFIFNESKKFREDSAKWLYTAITRASKKLMMI